MPAIPTKVCSQCHARLPRCRRFFYYNQHGHAFPQPCKACKQKARLLYEATHKKETKERCHRWYEQNKERVRATAKRWEIANSEKYALIKQRFKEKHREKINERSRQWRKENPLLYAVRMAVWASKNKEKVRAKRKAQYYVKTGKLIRPNNCSVCGRETKVSGHHSDYNKPLSVEWLCGSCHRKRHIKEKNHGRKLG